MCGAVITYNMQTRISNTKLSIRACCERLGHSDTPVFVERHENGVFTVRVEVGSTAYSLCDAEPPHNDPNALIEARYHMLRCIRADMMNKLHGAPRVRVDGKSGSVVVNPQGTWDI